MSDREQPGERLSSTGHHYQGVHVGPGAKAHVGNTYNISQFLIDAEEEHH
jgi:hypothetical protein